jgi:hypothetical protein
MNDEIKPIKSAAVNAAAFIAAIYEHVDRVDAAGGTASISGISACHAMLKSLKAQRSRVDKLIIAPLVEAIKSGEIK